STKEQQSGGLILGNLWVVLLMLFAWDDFTSITPFTVAGLLFLGVVQIGIGYIIFTYGQRRIPATESAMIAMLEPVFNPIWVGLGYGEWASPLAWLGGMIIVTALAVRLWREMRVTYPASQTRSSADP